MIYLLYTRNWLQIPLETGICDDSEAGSGDQNLENYSPLLLHMAYDQNHRQRSCTEEDEVSVPIWWTHEQCLITWNNTALTGHGKTSQVKFAESLS